MSVAPDPFWQRRVRQEAASSPGDPLFQQPSQSPSSRQGPPSLFGPPRPSRQPVDPATTAPPTPPRHNPTLHQVPPEQQRPAHIAPVQQPPMSPADLGAGPAFQNGAHPYGPQALAFDAASLRTNAVVRWSTLALAASLAAAVVAFMASAMFLTPIFEASARAIVQPIPGQFTGPPGQEPDIFEGFLSGEQIAPTFRELALGQPVITAVATSTGTPAGTIAQGLSVRTVPRTPLLVISFRHPDRGLAAQYANAAATAMSDASVREQWVSDRELAVVEAAQVPGSPVSPNPTRNALIAFLAVAAVIGGLGFAIESNRRHGARL